MRTLGLDIGGANIKASDGEQQSISLPFPLWKQPEQLADALRTCISRFGSVDRLAVNMTGELADCFRTKAEGVNQILDAVVAAADKREILVWQTGGEFVDVPAARDLVSLVSAANWHALATWVARMVPSGSALLIDLGSTTTDIIPILNGLPMPLGLTDVERLVTGELVYVGARRTPLIGLLHEVSLSGVTRPLANEFFASSVDFQLVLGRLSDEPENCETANGRPATRTAALDRLARQLCGDVSELTESDLCEFARQCQSELCRRVQQAIAHVCPDPMTTTVILAGEGDGLAADVLPLISTTWGGQTRLSQLLGPQHSAAACAYAVARLGQEQPVWTDWLFI